MRRGRSCGEPGELRKLPLPCDVLRTGLRQPIAFAARNPYWRRAWVRYWTKRRVALDWQEGHRQISNIPTLPFRGCHMHPAIQITAYPAGRDQFRAMVGDRVIVVSDQPFEDAARVLLAEVTPATPIVMHYLGQGYERSTVGAVAGPPKARKPQAGPASGTSAGRRSRERAPGRPEWTRRGYSVAHRFARGGDGGASGSLRISPCQQFPTAIPIKSPTKSDFEFHNSNPPR
jgi:hypothetical protein